MLTERNQAFSPKSEGTMTYARAFSKRIPATQLAVRGLLKTLCDLLETSGTDTDGLGRVEIVLAEALNNVVEHAYANAVHGGIDLKAHWTEYQIEVTILDSGAPVPDYVLSPRNGPDVEVNLDALPEGGFGWMLIQRMTTRLSYRRIACLNCLQLTIPLTDD